MEPYRKDFVLLLQMLQGSSLLNDNALQLIHKIFQICEFCFNSGNALFHSLLP